MHIVVYITFDVSDVSLAHSSHMYTSVEFYQHGDRAKL